MLLISSCRKDSAVEFTSDVPNGYRTDIVITYFEPLNTTTVKVAFNAGNQQSVYESRYVLLPPDGYIKYNGLDLSAPHGYNFYQNEFNGKETCTIELKDYDGIIYTNVLIPSYTAYFINLPDTITAFSDFQLHITLPLSTAMNGAPSVWIRTAMTMVAITTVPTALSIQIIFHTWTVQ